jgi:hypothetical protein
MALLKLSKRLVGLDMRAQPLKVGFDFHLVKPIDLDEVERLMAAANYPATN